MPSPAAVEPDLLIPAALDAELTGYERQGRRAPCVRVPGGRTRLSGVLLAANPWEQRELAARLKHIQQHRTRKIKSLEWSQRHFFVSQVFNPDFSLRFTKEQPALADQRLRGIFSLPTNVCAKKRQQTRELSDMHFPPLGAAPKQQARRPQRHHKPTKEHKIRQEQDETSRSTPNIYTASCGEMNGSHFGIHQRRDDIVSGDIKLFHEEKRHDGVPRISNRDTAVSLPLITEQTGHIVCSPVQHGSSLSPRMRNASAGHHHSSIDLTDDAGVDQNNELVPMAVASPKKGITSRTVVSPAHFSKRKKKTQDTGSLLLKSCSLPSLNVQVGFDEMKTPSSDTKQISSSRSTAADSTEEDGELCEPDVIKKITDTLPMSLMIKANQNINEVVHKKKQSLKKMFKKDAEKDVFADPRYSNLSNMLVKIDA